MKHWRLLLYLAIFSVISIPAAMVSKRAGGHNVAFGAEERDDSIPEDGPGSGENDTSSTFLSSSALGESNFGFENNAVLLEEKIVEERTEAKEITEKTGKYYAKTSESSANTAVSANKNDSANATGSSASDATATTSAATATSAPETEETGPVERWVSESELNSFYKDAVFVGDSITEGFKLYCNWHMEDPFIPQFRFLSRVSFGLHNALWEIGHHTVMPIYEGKERYIWDSIQMMGAKQVYMMFGQNDLDMGNDSVEKYGEVINRIHEKSPEATFVILSMTYTLRGKGKGALNNDNIRTFNATMKQVCANNGWGFIDMANPLSDANGDLAADYCSDHYVHLTTSAYHVWETVLKEYAINQLKYTPMPDEVAAEAAALAAAAEAQN